MSTERKYYCMADALRMTLTRDNKTGKVTGEKTFTLSDEGFSLPITCRVEANYETMSGDVILYLKMKGNLRTLMIATGRDLWLFYVNAARVSELGLKQPDVFAPTLAHDYIVHLQPAIVRSFKQTGKVWTPTEFAYS